MLLSAAVGLIFRLIVYTLYFILKRIVICVVEFLVWGFLAALWIEFCLPGIVERSSSWGISQFVVEDLWWDFIDVFETGATFLGLQ